MQAVVLTWAKSGLNVSQALVRSRSKLGQILSCNIPSCSRPRFSPHLWAETVTEKPYPSPPSELPPLEETGGQWLAVEAEGQDCLSFINGKVTMFTLLMMADFLSDGAFPNGAAYLMKSSWRDQPCTNTHKH